MPDKLIGNARDSALQVLFLFGMITLLGVGTFRYPLLRERDDLLLLFGSYALFLVPVLFFRDKLVAFEYQALKWATIFSLPAILAMGLTGSISIINGAFDTSPVQIHEMVVARKSIHEGAGKGCLTARDNTGSKAVFLITRAELDRTTIGANVFIKSASGFLKLPRFIGYSFSSDPT